MLFNELITGFPWYDKIEKQNRYNEHTGNICDYKLISPADALLPFQFYRSVGGAAPVSWQVYDANSQTIVANLNNDIPLLVQTVKEGKEYFTYYGQGLQNIALSTGFYYSRLNFPDGQVFFSEMFHIPENLFYVANANDTQFLKITWYNNSDLRPIFYNDKDGFGVPKFKNTLYVDTFIHASEPQITEEGAKDGNDEQIITFQKIVIPYRITIEAPDFLKKALHTLPMHDIVNVQTKKGVREGNIENLKVTSTLEAFGALSVVDLLFSDDLVIVKKGCPDNMV